MIMWRWWNPVAFAVFLWLIVVVLLTLFVAMLVSWL
jgi:hypothetical protein